MHLQLRGRRPQAIDRIASIVGLLTPWIFIAIMRRLHQPWSPVLTWSILGGLVAVSGYDLLRNFLPDAWLRRVWVQEHLVKMMSAYIAITSAFAGTVFARYMPWAAIIPSVVGTGVAAGFLIAGPRAWRRGRERQFASVPRSRHARRPGFFGIKGPRRGCSAFGGDSPRKINNLVDCCGQIGL